MTPLRRFRLALLFSLLIPALAGATPEAPPLIRSSDKLDAREMSSADMDRVTSEGPKYDFTFVDQVTISDPSGQKIALAGLKKHLKRGKYNKRAFVVLWFESDAQLPDQAQLEAVLSPFQSYGFRKFAVRRRPGNAAATAAAPGGCQENPRHHRQAKRPIAHREGSAARLGRSPEGIAT